MPARPHSGLGAYAGPRIGEREGLRRRENALRETGAPRRNRTFNLLIKSRMEGPGRTGTNRYEA
jgi:hypothetical protein